MWIIMSYGDGNFQIIFAKQLNSLFEIWILYFSVLKVKFQLLVASYNFTTIVINC